MAPQTPELRRRKQQAMEDRHPKAALAFTRKKIAEHKDELEQLYEVERVLINRLADEKAARA